jgi:hypothetical protein
VCTINFVLTNSATAQVSPPVNVSAAIEDGSENSLGEIPPVPVDKMTQDLYGVLNGASLLLVVVPTFATRVIGQSTPVTASNNTLTMTIVANINLAPGSTITVSGLTGSQTVDKSTLTISSSNGGFGSSGTWDQSSGALVLTAMSEGISAGAACLVNFSLHNPAHTQSSPPVSISAAIQSGGGAMIGSVVWMAMDKPNTGIFGVHNGTNPLEVLLPAFTSKIIAQSNPMAGADNTLFVTLATNYNLQAGSKVTISGLRGASTADSAALDVSTTGGSLGVSGSWTRDDGSLVLTAASNGIVSGSIYIVSFELTNPTSPQSSPAVSASASIRDGNDEAIGSISFTVMTAPGLSLYGVPNGADPLRIWVPSFTSTVAFQVTPFAGMPNSITVNVTLNCDLPTGSRVTFTGLTGSQTTGTTSLTVSTTSGRLGTTSQWQQSTAH